MEPSWNLTSGPLLTTPEPIWAETQKLPAHSHSLSSVSDYGHCLGVYRFSGQQRKLGNLLGPPVVPFYPFLGEGSPTKIDYRKVGTLILTSLLEELAFFGGQSTRSER